VSFAAITLCVASQRVFIVVIALYFVIDSVRRLLDTPSYIEVADEQRYEMWGSVNVVALRQSQKFGQAFSLWMQTDKNISRGNKNARYQFSITWRYMIDVTSDGVASPQNVADGMALS
jgi:hypothetical protein